MPRKRMYTTTELIQHLKSKGITFSYMDTAETQHMLDTTNYYFKLTSYRKNFAKDNDEKYINLDFAYLTEFSCYRCAVKRIPFRTYIRHRTWY